MDAKFAPSRSREVLRHPGRELSPRFSVAGCQAKPVRFDLQPGQSLLDAITVEMERLGGDAAVLQLDGIALEDMHYVIPAGARDDSHAAWYSETYTCKAAQLQHATAMVGRKDGQWFVHCHALWRSGGQGVLMGHLLNDQCRVTAPFAARGHVLTGAMLEVALDPETNFPLFHVRRAAEVAVANGALLTIRPHEDLRGTIERACAELGIGDARLIGLGSLIGAEFRDAGPMLSPISEVLLLDGARVRDGRCEALPLICVDPQQATFRGDLNAGAGPVCVTFEMLILAES